MSEAATSGQGLSWRAACGIAVLVLTLTMIAMAQANYHADDPQANQVLSGSAFGYADLPGRQVLVPVETALARGMKGFRKAVAVPGRVVDLTYAGAQHGADAGADAGRFAGTPGAVFAASQGMEPGSDVLVATEAFLAERDVLAVTPATGDRACDDAARQGLLQRTGREIVWCREVATLSDGGRLSLARFAPHGRDELVVLAYSAPGGQPAYLEYPGSADPGGTWRLDDGGEFSLDAYRPLFAFRGPQGLELAVRWSGPEGDALDLYRQADDSFTPFVAATWAHPE
ncbi:hypothetical protein [Desulfovibrio sp. TomC]|uniref:hypothetical protein n=1 Tax=Desulfovibrio sp. TomC TaxID=1562888 RepID=UPI0005732CE3|nr:hypothetical protein [Desulfovibrio sp. TomC]KHK02994.1 hypothetical protein NY78_1523 [Desulfovibrio sp. TomC]